MTKSIKSILTACVTIFVSIWATQSINLCQQVRREEKNCLYDWIKQLELQEL